MRRPTANEFWSFAQRYLAFDDPSDWWNRLLELLARHSKKPVKSFASLALRDQAALLHEAYGADDSKSSLTLFNTLLGTEIARRWQVQALDVWKLPFKDRSAVDSHEVFISTIRHMNLDWDEIASNDAIAADPRIRFLLDWREEYKIPPRTSELPGSFLSNVLMLVEGPTEALLLPHYGARLGLDFNLHGINVLSAGGAKQVARKYFESRETFAIPIIAVLDADAEEEAEAVHEALREEDRMFIFDSGEIEDAIDLASLLTNINHYLANNGFTVQMQISDLDKTGRRTAVLNQWWRRMGLGDFDKIGLAEMLVADKSTVAQVPPEIKELLEVVKSVA